MKHSEIFTIREQFDLSEHGFCETIKFGCDSHGEVVIGLFRNDECIGYHVIDFDNLRDLLMRFKGRLQ